MPQERRTGRTGQEDAFFPARSNLWKGGSAVATKLKNLKIRKVDFVDEGADRKSVV